MSFPLFNFSRLLSPQAAQPPALAASESAFDKETLALYEKHWQKKSYGSRKSSKPRPAHGGALPSVTPPAVAAPGRALKNSESAPILMNKQTVPTQTAPALSHSSSAVLSPSPSLPLLPRSSYSVKRVPLAATNAGKAKAKSKKEITEMKEAKQNTLTTDSTALSVIPSPSSTALFSPSSPDSRPLFLIHWPDPGAFAIGQQPLRKLTPLGPSPCFATVLDPELDSVDPSGISLRFLLDEWKTNFLAEKGRFLSKATFVSMKYHEVEAMMGKLERPNVFLAWISADLFFELLSGWSNEAARSLSESMLTGLLGGIYSNIKLDSGYEPYFVQAKQLLIMLRDSRAALAKAEKRLGVLQYQWKKHAFQWRPAILRAIERWQQTGLAVTFMHWRHQSRLFSKRFEEPTIVAHTFPAHLRALRRRHDLRHSVALQFLHWREWAVQSKFLHMHRELGEVAAANEKRCCDLRRLVDERAAKAAAIRKARELIADLNTESVLLKLQMKMDEGLLSVYKRQSDDSVELLDYFSCLYVRALEEQEFQVAQLHYSRYQDASGLPNFHRLTNIEELIKAMQAPKNHTRITRAQAARRLREKAGGLMSPSSNRNANKNNQAATGGAGEEKKKSGWSIIRRRPLHRKERVDSSPNAVSSLVSPFLRHWVSYQCWQFHDAFGMDNGRLEHGPGILPLLERMSIGRSHRRASLALPDSIVAPVLQRLRALSLTKFHSPVTIKPPQQLSPPASTRNLTATASSSSSSTAAASSSSSSSSSYISSSATSVSASFLRFHLLPRDPHERQHIQSQFARRSSLASGGGGPSASSPHSALRALERRVSASGDRVALMMSEALAAVAEREKDIAAMRRVRDNASGLQVSIRYLLSEAPSSSPSVLAPLFKSLPAFAFPVVNAGPPRWLPHALLASVGSLAPEPFAAHSLVRAHRFIQHTIQLMPFINSTMPNNNNYNTNTNTNTADNKNKNPSPSSRPIPDNLQSLFSSFDPALMATGLLWLCFTYPSLPQDLDPLVLQLSEVHALAQQFAFNPRHLKHADQLRCLVDALRKGRQGIIAGRREGWRGHLLFMAQLREAEGEISRKLMKRIRKQEAANRQVHVASESTGAVATSSGAQLATVATLAPSDAAAAPTAAADSAPASPTASAPATSVIVVDPIVFSPRVGSSSPRHASSKPTGLAALLASKAGLSHSFNKRAEAVLAHQVIQDERKHKRQQKINEVQERERELLGGHQEYMQLTQLDSTTNKDTPSNHSSIPSGSGAGGKRPSIQLDLIESESVSAIQSPVVMNNKKTIAELDADSEQDALSISVVPAGAPSFAISVDSAPATAASQVVIVDNSALSPSALSVDPARLSSVFHAVASTPNHQRLHQSLAVANQQLSASFGGRRLSSIANVTPSAGNQGRFPVAASNESELRACETIMAKYMKAMREIFAQALEDKKEAATPTTPNAASDDLSSLIDPADPLDNPSSSRLSRVSFASLCRRRRLLAKTLSAAAVDVIVGAQIQAANAAGQAGDALGFDDFIECLIKMASMKYAALPDISSRLALFFGRDLLANSPVPGCGPLLAHEALHDFRSQVALSCDYIFDKHNPFLSSLFKAYASHAQSESGYFEASMDRDDFAEFVGHTGLLARKVISVRTVQQVWVRARGERHGSMAGYGLGGGGGGASADSSVAGEGGGQVGPLLETMVYFEFLEALAALSCHQSRNPYLSLDVKLDSFIVYLQQPACSAIQARRKSHLILKGKIDAQREKNRQEEETREREKYIVRTQANTTTGAETNQLTAQNQEQEQQQPFSHSSDLSQSQPPQSQPDPAHSSVESATAP